MTCKKKIVVSGMRPTGLLHLGHYFGVLQNWTKLQQDYQCYFFVADWHSLTTEYSQVGGVQESLRNMVIDWLAVGIEPQKATLFVQSHVPEHAELHLLFSMMTPLGWLERVPSYKEMQRELKDRDLSTYGFLGYPLLQTADVALYKANLVPVGQDQVAHIELSREIVRRFNHLYKEIFPEPQSLLAKTPKILGTDGRKMSKSYQNSIYLSDAEGVFNDKIKKHITDPARERRQDPGHPDICPIFAYHQQVTPGEAVKQISNDCQKASIGCVDCKKILITNMDNALGDFRQKRAKLAGQEKKINEILDEGSQKARKVASQTLEEANEVMGLRVMR